MKYIAMIKFWHINWQRPWTASKYKSTTADLIIESIINELFYINQKPICAVSKVIGCLRYYLVLISAHICATITMQTGWTQQIFQTYNKTIHNLYAVI